MVSHSPHDAHPQVVVMGVSGSGKSTIGTRVAERLGIEFVDGDALHPSSNVQKMARGIPLDDQDRWPWLERVGEELVHADGRGLVVACSALKRAYRDLIARSAPRTVFVLLDAPEAVLHARLADRTGHFMPSGLLESQLETLERLQADERGFTVDVTNAVDDVVEQAVAGVRAVV